MRIARKVRIVQALLLGGLFFLSGCASSSLKPRLSAQAQAEALSHFSLGLLAEAGGDPAAALEHLQAVLQLDPDEEKLYAPAVAVALELNQPDDAVRLAKQLVKRHPNTANSSLLLARVYALTGKPDQSETLFRKIRMDFPDNPDAPALLTRLYLSQGRRVDALKTLRSAVAEQNENIELLQLLGSLCIDTTREMGDSPNANALIQEGLGFLQQACALSPEDPRNWQQLGLVLLAVKHPDEALDAFQKARLYASDDLTLARQVLELLIQTEKYDEALAICASLASDTGTESELWLQYLAEKIPAEERTRLTDYLEKQIHEQTPAPASCYTQLGSLFIDSGENQKAEAVLTEALGHYPADNRLRIVLGFLYVQQERYDDAYTELNQVRTKSPETEWINNLFYLYNFLVAAQQTSHLEEAVRTLSLTYTNNPAILNQYILSLLTGESPVSIERTIELLTLFHTQNPEAAEVLYYLTLLQVEQKEYGTAIQTAEQFKKLATESGRTNLLTGEFYYQYAALYERTGQLDDAEKLFIKSIELSDAPLAAAAQNYIAYMWAERGEKLDAGLELIQKALVVDPENGAFLDTLGWIYYMQGRYAEALNVLEKAKESIQIDPTVWEHLGDTWLKLGDQNEASKHWKKALELDPESKELKERLKELEFTPDESPAPRDIPADTMPRP